MLVYAGTWAVSQRARLVRLGAAGVMANRDELISSVLRSLGRDAEPSVELQR